MTVAPCFGQDWYNLNAIPIESDDSDIELEISLYGYTAWMLYGYTDNCTNCITCGFGTVTATTFLLYTGNHQAWMPCTRGPPEMCRQYSRHDIAR